MRRRTPTYTHALVHISIDDIYLILIAFLLLHDKCSSAA